MGWSGSGGFVVALRPSVRGDRRNDAARGTGPMRWSDNVFEFKFVRGAPGWPGWFVTADRCGTESGETLLEAFLVQLASGEAAPSPTTSSGRRQRVVAIQSRSSARMTFANAPVTVGCSGRRRRRQRCPVFCSLARWPPGARSRTRCYSRRLGRQTACARCERLAVSASYGNPEPEVGPG